MELKRGYKQSEVGAIPEEWKVVTATEACELVVDCKNRTPPVVTESEFAVIRTPNVRNGQFVLEDLRFTDEKSFRIWTERAVPQFGDIMITREAPLGEVCAVPPDRTVCLGQRMMLYRPLPARTNSSYFLYALMSEPVRNNLFRKIGGSTVGHAKVDDIRFLQLPLPSLPEQRAIAEALSDVDGLLGTLEALIAKKRAIKRGTMQQLLTGKTRLPGFSGTWEKNRLGDFVAIRNQKVFPSQVDPETPCVELEHIGHGNGRLLNYSTARYSTSSKYRFFPEDVLFGRLRPYLRKFWHADRTGICTTEIWPLTADAKQASSGFLRALVETESFIDMASISYGTHMPRADWAVMKNFEIWLPDVAEQKAIATVLSDMDAEIAALEARREKTRSIKQGMMQQLLTGRIRLVKPQQAEADA